MHKFLKHMSAITLMLTAILLVVTSGLAQMSGSRGGVYSTTPQSPQAKFVDLTPEAAQSFIVVEGKSVLSVQPTAIRIVLAVTHEAKTSKECKTGIEGKIAELRPLWIQAGVEDGNIVEDFISILPQYDFEAKQLGGQQVAMEKRVGFLMQTNIHLANADIQAVKLPMRSELSVVSTVKIYYESPAAEGYNAATEH